MFYLEPVEKPKTSKIREFNFEELIGQYPGLASRNTTTESLFGIDFDEDSDIIPHIIASANAVYDPKRDGRKIS